MNENETGSRRKSRQRNIEREWKKRERKNQEFTKSLKFRDRKL
jgi:hypothetical protein